MDRHGGAEHPNTREELASGAGFADFVRLRTDSARRAGGVGAEQVPSRC